MLSARVEPLAAVVFVRHLRGDCERLAADLDRVGTPDGYEAARQIRAALKELQWAADQCAADRRREREGSAAGTSEPGGTVGAGPSGVVVDAVRFGTREVAHQLGISESLVTRYCRKHQLVGTKQSGRWFVTQQAINDFVEKRSKG